MANLFQKQLKINNSASQGNYWRDKLGDPFTVTEFPTVSKVTCSGDETNIRVPTDIVEQFAKFTNNSPSSRFIFLISGIICLLSKLTGNTDIVLGVPIPKQKSTKKLINSFVLLRQKIRPEMSLRDLLFSIKEDLSQSLKNVNYPLDVELAELGLDHSSVMVVVRDDSIHEGFGSFFNGSTRITFFEIDGEFYLKGVVNVKNVKLAKYLGYVIKIYRLLCDSPDMFINKIDLVDETERLSLYCKMHGEQRHLEEDEGIIELIEKQISKSPMAIAIETEDTKVTFSELKAQMLYAAGILAKNGIKKGDVVICRCNRSVHQIASILAILKIGAVCFPVDTDCPDERLVYYINDCNAEYMLCSDNCESSKFPILCISIDWSLFGNEVLNVSDGFVEVGKKDLAYVIYTSGSTGQPKGVFLTHEGIINHALTKIDVCQLRMTDKVCQNFNMVFVASIWQIVAPLMVGASITIVSEKVRKDPVLLLDFIKEKKVNCTRIGGHTYYQNIFIHGGCVHVQENKKEI
ncbi:MAG: AMP-binding protein [Fibrobacter sp.]|nr:AMP-binding protein [Fibrobacter sp.]